MRLPGRGDKKHPKETEPLFTLRISCPRILLSSPILAPLNFFRNMSIENNDRPEPADSISAPNSSAESRSAPMQPMPLLFYSEGNLLSRQASASLSACKAKLSPQHALALSILLLANLCPNPVKTHDVDPIFLYDHPTRTPTM